MKLYLSREKMCKSTKYHKRNLHIKRLYNIELLRLSNNKLHIKTGGQTIHTKNASEHIKIQLTYMYMLYIYIDKKYTKSTYVLWR